MPEAKQYLRDCVNRSRDRRVNDESVDVCGLPVPHKPLYFSGKRVLPYLHGDYSYEVVDASKVVTEINVMHRIAYHLANKATDWQITDARGAPRFLGEVPEPRPGLRSGHITGSKNLPFTELVDAETGELKTDKELAQIITNAGIDTTLGTVNSCGSGVTACIVDLSLRILGAEKTAIYDGSWSEYVSVL